jgi:dinuclear metal center YbgI/SA1388 family protein
MSPTVAEAVALIEGHIVMSKAAQWDAVGLQVGDPQAMVHRVGVCHEVTQEVIAAAVAAKTDLLVSYHPLLFAPTIEFVQGASAAGRAHRLAAAGIALHVVHTAFDVAPGGCADALAEILGLGGVVGFGPGWPAEAVKIVTFVPEAAAGELTAAMAAAGAGRIGKYAECSFTVDGTGSYRPQPGSRPLVGEIGELSREDEVRIEMTVPGGAVDSVVAAVTSTHPYDEPAFDIYTVKGNSGFVGRVGVLEEPTPLAMFADRNVRLRLRARVRVAGDSNALVHRVAVVPGSGADLLGAAADSGADVLVTGDVSHHRAHDALRRSLAVIDAGHAPTERPGVARLYSLVSDLFEEVTDLTHIDASPWGNG